MSIKSKRAYITGVFGQDGSYLAEYLLEQGYEVRGLAHSEDSIHPDASKLKEHSRFSVSVADLCDTDTILADIQNFIPDEMYNIAAVSDLKTAEERPEYTYAVNFLAFKNMVEGVARILPHIRIFQALSSRILKSNDVGVISEQSLLLPPKNEYDRAKRDSYTEVVLKCRKEGLFITSGFLCNHESPRRGNRFVTGRIAHEVAQIACGQAHVLAVGNVDAKRDWSYAGDVVRAMHAILNETEPQDFVIGSGTLHTVRDFIDIAFFKIHMPLTWSGEGLDTQAYDSEGNLRVMINPAFYQVDDNPVVSDISKLTTHTGWKPVVSFEALVGMMVENELKRI